jgi:hypothetical protein
LDLIYSQLQVARYPPAPGIDVNYCVGCWNALRWVLGRPDQDDLYREATRDKMDRLSPEQRAKIRLRAEVDAGQYLHHEERITALQQALSVS